MKPICVLLALFLYAPVAHAQIKMATSGNVAIGTTVVQPNMKIFSHYQGSFTGTRHAIYGYSQSGTTRIGVWAQGSSGSTNYGLRATASNGTTNYAVYGDAYGGSSANWAGYFNGSLYATSGPWSTSDQRMKEDVRAISGSDALERLLNLRTRSYRFKKGEEFTRFALPEGEHFGLIAQEVEEILPHIVTDVIQPPELDENGNEVGPAYTLRAVNYLELVPLLIRAVQEQQARIEALEAAVGER